MSGSSRRACDKRASREPGAAASSRSARRAYAAPGLQHHAQCPGCQGDGLRARCPFTAFIERLQRRAPVARRERRCDAPPRPACMFFRQGQATSDCHHRRETAAMSMNPCPLPQRSREAAPGVRRRWSCNSSCLAPPFALMLIAFHLARGAPALERTFSTGAISDRAGGKGTSRSTSGNVDLGVQAARPCACSLDLQTCRSRPAAAARQ